MSSADILFFVLLPIVAFLYASVGHGGASGYLALMALFSFAPETMRPTALVLNILVSGAAFYHYYKTGPMPWNVFLPLILASVPGAYFGGTVDLEGTLYRKILGVLLILPALRLLGIIKLKEQESRKASFSILLLAGAAIGLFSGLIGIGGGIILSPLLLLLGWASFKQTAAISALFIFCNSIAGLLGTANLGINLSPFFGAIVVVAFGGGLLGAYFGTRKFQVKTLTTLLGVVLFIASAKLIFS